MPLSGEESSAFVTQSGIIVEFIDRQKIKCAVVLETKSQRLRLLSENNREVKVSMGRIIHKSRIRLDLSMGRDKLLAKLKEKVNERVTLSENVDIKELWEVLNSEQETIDLSTMTEFCFPKNPADDHESAVLRAFFQDNLYFKFSTEGFFPNSEEKVEHLKARVREEARKNKIIARGAECLSPF